MIYDLIIIGAGASGLFAGAALSAPVNGLIIEKKSCTGQKTSHVRIRPMQPYTWRQYKRFYFTLWKKQNSNSYYLIPI